MHLASFLECFLVTEHISWIYGRTNGVFGQLSKSVQFTYGVFGLQLCILVTAIYH